MEIEIKKLDHFGKGIGKINNKIIFVPKVLENEIVNVKIIKEKSKFIEAYPLNIIKKSPNRVESICKYYDKCGGCSFLHTTYEKEKNFKIKKGIELLGKIDNFYETDNLNYRNKVTLHVKNNKIGLYEGKTNDVVEINYCYLCNDLINKVINDLNKIDISKIKTITIKSNLDKILLSIDGILPNNFEIIFNYVDTIINNDKIIKGNGYIEEIIDDYKFIINKDAFFQVNKNGLINIFNIIKEYLKDKTINNVLDLYSGTGLWGILISKYVKKIISIESFKPSTEIAKKNIKNNSINNIEIINVKVEDYIDKFNNIDLVITDPPRSGLDNKTVGYLKKIKSKYFIYISCDMQTLKRDLNSLSTIYDVKCINLVDMFRGTYHCECVILLCRKSVDK